MGEFNLARLAESAFERLGDYEGLFFEGRWIRTGELFDRGLRLAGGLIQLGLQPNDRVVVMLPNGPEVPVTYGGIWRAGGVITPAMFLLPADEVSRIVKDSEASYVVTSSDFLGVVQSACEGSKVRAIISTGAEDGTTSWQSLTEAEPAPLIDRDDDDMASLLYTGGTTGRSKGVMLTHRNHAFCSRGLYRASYVEGENVSMTALPLAHAFGLMVTVMSFFAEEQSRTVLMRWFDPMAWLSNVQDFKIKRAAGVPSMLQMLLSAPIEDYDLSSWTFMGVGSAPLAREVIEEFERRVPGCTIHEGYGCTESGGGATASPPYNPRIGAVGKPFEGYDIRIFDPDDDSKELAVGELGEVCIRSEGVMKGYWKSPDVSAQALRNGWLHTGDIGRFDEDGYLYILDRIKDLIIRGGFNVYPRDVEDVLLEHPAVTFAGVVGKPDPKYGEEVVAFVSLDGVATEDELIAHCKERIGGYKYPRELRILPYLPLTPVGKVDRKALRAML